MFSIVKRENVPLFLMLCSPGSIVRVFESIYLKFGYEKHIIGIISEQINILFYILVSLGLVCGN